MSSRKRISTWKRIGLILAVILVSFAVNRFISFKNQTEALDEAKAHIQSIHPLWLDFQNMHPGSRAVGLRSHTSPMGSIAASGFVPDEKTTEQILTFLNSTQPPNGVRMMTIVDPVRFKEDVRLTD